MLNKESLKKKTPTTAEDDSPTSYIQNPFSRWNQWRLTFHHEDFSFHVRQLTSPMRQDSQMLIFTFLVWRFWDGQEIWKKKKTAIPRMNVNPFGRFFQWVSPGKAADSLLKMGTPTSWTAQPIDWLPLDPLASTCGTWMVLLCLPFPW